MSEIGPAGYKALPEEVCRRIEVVDGAMVVNADPGRPHQRAARRLANALEEVCGPRFAVDTDIDLRLRDVPLLNRRPDIVVYDRALPDDAVLRPQHCLLVVEIMSPGSVTTDQTDKPSEYAASEIPYFWRVESAEADERKLTVFRHRLDPTTRTYAVAGVDTGTMVITDPFDLVVDLADLTAHSPQP
jgi:Uma2 family endonuclease